VKELNPAVPDGLQQILNWMLAKNANQRYPTPERAAQALQVFLAAGSEGPHPLEEGPQLRRYLTWLEDSNNGERPEPRGSAPAPAAATAPAASVSRPAAAPTPTPAAQPIVSPAPSLVEAPARRAGSKKHKRHKRSAAPKTIKAPAAAAPALLSKAAEEFDVELVPVPMPPPPMLQSPWYRLSQREWIILGIGAGSVIVAVVLGMLLAQMLQ
jgi:hypothetical protein